MTITFAIDTALHTAQSNYSNCYDIVIVALEIARDRATDRRTQFMISRDNYDTCEQSHYYDTNYRARERRKQCHYLLSAVCNIRDRYRD